MFRALVLLAVMCAVTACGGLRIASEQSRVPAADGREIVVHREFEWKGRGSQARPARGVMLFVGDTVGLRGFDITEQLAGAAAMGFDVVHFEVQGESADSAGAYGMRTDDARIVLRQYLSAREVGHPVVVLGRRWGCAIAAAVAAHEPSVTHVMLLDIPYEVTTRDGPSTQMTSIAHAMRQGADEHRFYGPVLQIVTVDPPANVIAVQALPPHIGAHAAAHTDVRLSGFRPDLRHVDSGHHARPLIEIALVRWLAATGVVPADEARRFEARVKRAHPEWNGYWPP